jgi:hypothetical protein
MDKLTRYSQIKYEDFFQNISDDDDKNKLIELLNNESITTLNKIKEIILSNDKNLINEIKFKFLYYQIIDIKEIISSNYLIKSISSNEDLLIYDMIQYVILEKNNYNKISYINNILFSNYEKKDKSIDDIIIRNEIIFKILELNLNQIITKIQNELNIYGIYIFDKFIKENNILTIYQLENILSQENNITLKKIYKILSKKEKDDKKKKNILTKYYNFINSFDYIYIIDIDKIFYRIDKINKIKIEIEKDDIIEENIKDIILKKIIYNTEDIINNINLKIKLKFFLENIYLTKIINLNILHIKDIMKIIELYHTIVSSNLTDNKIKEIVIEIKTINNHNNYEYLLNEFIRIKLYYKFDYNKKFDNFDEFNKYLEDFYIYKNYIYVIRNLYIYLLLIKDNFNLLYTTIEKLKKTIELYKKIDHDSMILFDKLNQVNNDKNKGVKFNDFNEIEKYLNNYLIK